MNDTLLLSDHVVSAAESCADQGADQSPRVGESLPMQAGPALHDCPDASFRGVILHKFAVRGVDQAAALERALRSGNAVELARQAQTLKQVAADLSADALCERADELERTAERGDLGEAGLALVRTREEIARCVEAAGDLLLQLAAE